MLGQRNPVRQPEIQNDALHSILTVIIIRTYKKGQPVI